MKLICYYGMEFNEKYCWNGNESKLFMNEMESKGGKPVNGMNRRPTTINSAFNQLNNKDKLKKFSFLCVGLN